MKYTITFTGQFKKSYKRCVKRGLDESIFQNVLSILASTGTLPAEYRPHRLQGKYKNCWECHLQPDWLLIWRQDDNALVLVLVDTGTHSDLF